MSPAGPMKPSEMRGEDVPTEVVDAAFGGYSMHGAGLVANLVAAAWPEIQRRVREQVAAEIEAAANALDPQHVQTVATFHRAARIARGGS